MVTIPLSLTIILKSGNSSSNFDLSSINRLQNFLIIKAKYKLYYLYIRLIREPLSVLLPLCPEYLNILLVIVIILNILPQITQINQLIINKQI